MEKIIEIVPNYSEGKNREVMEKIIAPFKGLDGIKLLILEMDASYNRSVVTAIGEAVAVMRGFVESAGLAAELIDMGTHRGEHPRMGALDVLPIIPIKGIDEKECIELSYIIGKEIHEKTGVPVYFYAKSAKRPQCEDLPDIRKGEFEGLEEKMKDSFWQPDLGTIPHPTAGAVAVGCRNFLVAYNIDTDSSSRKKVLRIARRVRFSGGGYRYIQAGAAKLEDRNICQVTMNLTDYGKTALYQAFEAVKMEARRYGINVTASEIVGLVPKECLTSSLKYYLGMDEEEELDLNLDETVELAKKFLLFRDFSKQKIIEYYLG